MAVDGLLLAGILVMIVVAVLGYALRSPQAPFRRIWRNDHGEVVAIGERKTAEPGRFNGRGSQLTDSVQLGAGNYRLDYQFEETTRVALVDGNGDETLFLKHGSGSEPLNISSSGAYRFLVEPASETAAWSLECRSMRQPPSYAAF